MGKTVEKTRCNNTMTEAEYLGWIRSALRSRWLRWAPRGEALNKARREYLGPNRQKWEYECALCHKYFPVKQVEVDHYPRDAGSISSIQDVGKFCENLFCETDNLRILCKPCHNVYTYSQKMKISLKQAYIEKEALNIIKAMDRTALLAKLKDLGYTTEEIKSEEKRRKIVRDMVAAQYEKNYPNIEVNKQLEKE